MELDLDLSLDLKLDFGNPEVEDDFNYEQFIEVEATADTRYIKPGKTRKMNPKRILYKYAVDLVKDIDLKKNDHIFAFISGKFIFGDFIEALIVEKNLKVKNLTISTLSYNQNNVDSLANLLNGGFVDNLHLMTSSYFYSHYRWTLVKYAYEKLDKENRFQYSTARNHTKIVLIETQNGFITIQGSANLRSSDCFEQIEIIEDKGIYEFNKEMLDLIHVKGNTIAKEDKNG